jgi:hypothetical protein
MATKKKASAIELTGQEYNSLKGFYAVGNNDLSGSMPTKNKRNKFGFDVVSAGRGRVAQRAITQRKNQQRKNIKRGAK